MREFACRVGSAQAEPTNDSRRGFGRRISILVPSRLRRLRVSAKGAERASRRKGERVDNKLFDAMVRGAVGAASRRGVLRIGIGTVAASALGVRGLNAEQFAHARKKKKRRKKRDRCRLLRGQSIGRFACGDGCCLRDRQVCCDDPSDPSGKSCFPRDSVCCPAALGGGACNEGHQCCSPAAGAPQASCANLSQGQHCCPPNSGGACEATFECCPSAFTNDENRGCCQEGSPCCNDDDDCFDLVGDPDAVCADGCCFGP
jgi:hypothetical protein